MLWLIFFAVFALFIYIKLWKPHQFWKERNVPHNKPWPIVGNMSRITFRQTSFAEGLLEMCEQFKNHRYFGLYQFLQPTLIVQDPDLLKQIGIKDYEYFLDHRSFVSEKLDPLFAKNLFSLKGQKWRDMRSTLSPAFTSSKMKSMFILISDCAERFTKYFLKNSEGQSHVTLEMKDLFTRFANDVIATCAFGVEVDSLEQRTNAFYVNGKRATNFDGLRGLKFFGYSISPFLMELFNCKLFDADVGDFFREMVIGTIKERERQGIHRPDMIHLLMEARKGKLKYDETVKSNEEDAGFATVKESEVGKQEQKTGELSDDDVTAQALIFFFAGFDTTSTMMSHMAHELAINPEIQKRLQNEVDATFAACKGKITYEGITKMKYLDMVICETLRKWPSAVISDRECTKEYTIDAINDNETSLHLKKGDHIWILTYSIHRNPKFFANPDKFDPERFSDENKSSIIPTAYLPFGMGPRNCIGSRFALLEAKIVFFHLLSKFNFIVDKKTQIPLKLSRTNINLLAENGFWLGLEPRKIK